MTSRRYPLQVLIAVLTLVAGNAGAHDPRPLVIDLELSGETIVVNWRTPSSIRHSDRPSPQLRLPCAALGPPAERIVAAAYHGSQRFRCPEDGTGIVLETGYRGANPSLSSVVRVIRDGTPPAATVLPPDVSVWSVPESDSPPKLGAYFRLGVEHLVGGLDHLAFLLCLMLIAASPGRVIVAATGFTIAHSLTLAAAALGVVNVPVIYVEAMIALSIVFMAAEILRGDRSTLTWRHPAAIALLFGLLHGFGFASVLADIGLPSGQALSALLLFNLGIEAAQLAVIALTGTCLAVLKSGAAVQVWRRAAGDRSVAVLTGVVAAFWTVERVLAFG